MFKHYINAELREETPSAEDPPASTGTPLPETPPVETPPETPPKDTGQDVIPEEEDLWGSLATDLDESEDLDTEEAVTPPAEPKVEPTPTPPVEPAVEPVVEPPAPTEEPVTPPVTPPEPVPVETPPAVEPVPPVTPPSEDEVKAENQKKYDDTVTALTERFSITEEEALQLVTEPAKVFPQLQARMFADMWEHMTAYVRQNLPAAIDQHTQVREVQQEQVNMFFDRFPKLNKKEHGATVAKVSGVFNQLNPNATEEEILNHVGIQTMMLHGIAPDMIPAKPNGDLPAVPETPVTPHVPAAVNTGRPAPIQQSDNIWAAMSEELDDD